MSVSIAALSQAFTTIVETTGQSVVRVEGGRRRPTSGVVWAPNQVVTVAHGLEQDELIVAGQGGELKANVKGRDHSTDLALLEIEGTLPVATFDDGASLKVGTVVLRVGRPGETVRATSGIISALGSRPFRAGRGGGEIARFIESDAGHRPGFSGGPLVDGEGRVVGLTSSALLRGTSLTIPTATVRRVVEQLAQYGQVRQSHLGLQLQPVQLPEPVRQATNEELGLLVVSVEQGGPAELAGVAYGDTVLHLGDDTVKTLDDLYAWLRADHVGAQVPVRLFRNGQVITVQLTVGAKTRA
jgi:S1-C subfamily serine protease